MKLSFISRRVLGLVAGLSLASLLDFYFSDCHQHWVLASTLLILQMKSRLSFSEMLIRAFIMLLIAGLLLFFLSKGWMLILHDIVEGVGLALISSLLFFPVKTDEDFRLAMQEMLKAYVACLNQVKEMLLDNRKESFEKKYALEKVQIDQNTYPEWVYAHGFNPRMQKGHRHFLMMMERVGQVLYILQDNARDLVIDQDLRKHVELLFFALESVFLQMEKYLGEGKEGVSIESFNLALQDLEVLLKEKLQKPLEFLDTQDKDLGFYAFIYQFRDMQFALKRLSEALR